MPLERNAKDSVKVCIFFLFKLLRRGFLTNAVFPDGQTPTQQEESDFAPADSLVVPSSKPSDALISVPSLLQELRRMQQDQARMNKEILSLRLQNERLNERMAQMAEGNRLLLRAFDHFKQYGIQGVVPIAAVTDSEDRHAGSADTGYFPFPSQQHLAIDLPASSTSTSPYSQQNPQTIQSSTSYFGQGNEGDGHSDLESAQPEHVAALTDQAFASWMSHKPMVVFDLSRTPAVLMTCNTAFCSLFGYRMDQIIGMPWKKFIDPGYFDRTMSILFKNSKHSDTAAFQFRQVYKNSQGASFVALDTHTFFYGINGPRADLVTISPLVATIPEPDNHHYWPLTSPSANNSSSVLESTSDDSMVVDSTTNNSTFDPMYSSSPPKPAAEPRRRLKAHLTPPAQRTSSHIQEVPSPPAPPFSSQPRQDSLPEPIHWPAEPSTDPAHLAMVDALSDSIAASSLNAPPTDPAAFFNLGSSTDGMSAPGDNTPFFDDPNGHLFYPPPSPGSMATGMELTGSGQFGAFGDVDGTTLDEQQYYMQ
jgi:PAS domain S-box-containing protein